MVLLAGLDLGVWRVVVNAVLPRCIGVVPCLGDGTVLSQRMKLSVWTPSRPPVVDSMVKEAAKAYLPVSGSVLSLANASR